MLLTFFLVVVGWVIFRAENITQAWDYLCRMFSSSLFIIPDRGRLSIVYIIILLAVEWVQRDKQHALQIDNVKIFSNTIIRWAFYLFFLFVILVYAGQQAEFIYFQF
ncbi:hypothetical protein EZS27_011434 [termite gut metagenome]|uniref:Peptidoglycan O-acetyltransferase n=1 Tax=termite gut metagenome TaxID=433724 RepID=A0A5J4S3P7_9ZZZZ